jgi:hypothetical protein
MAASAHGTSAVSGSGHAVHGAVSHGGHASSNGHANHSGLSLGLASVSPVASHAPHPAAVGPAALLDTPAPIRELVQAHHAHNGAESHGAGLAVASAPSVLANGESDALSTLNLGGGWRQPGAPLAPADGRLSSAAIAAATGARPGQRTLKLAVGAVALVGICLALFFVAFRKPAPPPPVASAPVAAPPEPVAKAPEPPKEVKPAPPSLGPAEATGETDVAGLRAETVARVAGSKKATRPAPVRNPSLRATAGPTAPGPLTALTPEQRAEANRFGDTSSKAIQLRNPTASVAKVTPAQGDITRVVNNNKGGIKVCYQRALLRDTSLTHGKIDVDVSIGISGRVKKVSIDGPAAFRSLDPCIKDVLSRWVFPASSEEYGTAFSYVFQGNE